MAHVEDRWTRPTDQLDRRGRVLRERTPRYGTGRRWLATWEESSQRRSRSFDSKDAATAHLGEVARAQRQGIHVLSHRMTVAEYAEQWSAAQIHQRPSSAEQMESRIRLHVLPALGHLRLREVTSRHVQAAVQQWSRDLAPSTVQVVYGYAAALFKGAVQDRLIGVTPCVGVKLPSIEAETVIPLTTPQVLTIADRFPPRARALVYLGAATGMRSGELRGITEDRLRWHDEIVTVRVDRQLTSTRPTWGPPKTSRSRRTITVDPVAAGLLRYHMMRFPPHPSGLLFTGRTGGPLARTSVATMWEAATAGMDLPDRSGLHQLRHYHASLLIAAGLSVTAVADRLGHKDATQTLQVYAHLWPTDEARSRDAIAGQLWG